MLKIRLQRTGRINNPSYRVVVVEHTASPKTGNVVELVGTYDPKAKVKNLAADRIKYWISVGAQASGTVHNMLVTAGIVKGKKVNVLPQKSPPKKEGEGEAAEAPKAEAAPAEAPKAEAVAETVTA
jgi:small subunit ribosomal protein S16